MVYGCQINMEGCQICMQLDTIASILVPFKGSNSIYKASNCLIDNYRDIFRDSIIHKFIYSSQTTQRLHLGKGKD